MITARVSNQRSLQPTSTTTSSSSTWVRTSLFVLLATGLFSTGCLEGCEPEPPLPPGAVGRVEARAVTGGFELVLSDLETPLRTLSVDVAVAGANATRAEASGPFAYDVVEAGLEQPSAAFTVVVADTRRVRLADGAIARVDVDGPGTITLSNAIAVDESGARVTLATADAP